MDGPSLVDHSPSPEQGHERERTLLAEQAALRSLVLFVGAGVSSAAGLPAWKALVAPLAQELGVDPNIDVLDLAQWYVDAHKRPALLERVVRALAPVHQPSNLHLALAQVPAPVFFTTNYDLLMERAIEQMQGVPPDVVIEDGHVGLVDEARRTTLVKLHGCLTLPETIVLTRDDYETYADRHRAMVAYLQSLLATRTFLFVGFSLVDPNFRAIYSTIARALGQHKRQAYLVEGVKRPEPLMRYWRQKGIVTITLDGYDRLPAFVREITGHTTRGRGALAAAHTLSRSEPPLLSVGPLLEQLESVRGSLAQVIMQARDVGLLPDEDDPSPEVPAISSAIAASGDAIQGGDANAGQQMRVWRRRKARALLDLAVALDGLAPLGDPRQWVSLGDLLYEQGDAVGATQAYQAALRPAQGLDDLVVRSDTIRRVRGNLARALAREGHYRRAEWLLRRCVYRDDVGEAASSPLLTGAVDRKDIRRRLDMDALRVRPTDAAELGHAITRRVERLRSDGHPGEAFVALAEVRYLLEPLLGIRPHASAPPEEDLFGAELAQHAAQRSWRARGLRNRETKALMIKLMAPAPILRYT